jgi:hypothetical protein
MGARLDSVSRGTADTSPCGGGRCVTPAMEMGIADHLRSFEEVVGFAGD